MSDFERGAEPAAAAADPIGRRYRMLVQNSHDVIVHSVAGVIEWISPSVLDLLGFPAEALVGTRSILLWHPDDAEEAVRLRAQADSGVPGQRILRLRHREGHYVPVSVAVRASDEPEGIVSALRDATALVAAEEALARREEEYRLLAENVADFVYRLGLDGSYEWVSPSVRGLLGWEPEELVGRQAFGLIHPDDLVKIRSDQAAHGLQFPVTPAGLARAYGGRAMAYEGRVLHKSGEPVWMMMSVRPLVVDGDAVGFVGSARVIEAEIAARTAAMASERLLVAAVDSAAIGIVSVDFEGRYLRVNPAWCRMVQQSEEWLLRNRSVDLLAVEDRHLFYVDREALLTGHESVCVRVVRYQRGDGTQLWIRRAAMLVRDADGTPDSLLLELEDITSERLAQERLDHLAFHDPLTGLCNRESILDRLDLDLAQAGREGGRVAVLYIDLDDFRTVNDSLGHDAGDELLRTIAGRLALLVAEERIGRMGGDEFLVLLNQAEDVAAVESLAEQVLFAVGEPTRLHGRTVTPSASIGIAVSVPGSDPGSLVRDADAALFRAKSAGRSGWHIAETGLHQEAVARLDLEGELRRALANRQFVPYFEPIVSLDDGRVVGHEALVRWRHPERGIVPPAQFLPLAEESGLIVEIGHQVLERVCQTLAERPDLSGTVSVNKSPRQLDRPTWKDAFMEVVERFGVDPSRLVVEVTETAVLHRVDRIRDGLRAVRDLGVGVHVDDFGTGYSSIALLRDLPVTGIKLDRSFTSTLRSGGASHALASGLAGLAHGLGLTGIAEGVETVEEAGLLRDMGWTLGQGKLFGLAAPGFAASEPLGRSG